MGIVIQSAISETIQNKLAYLNIVKMVLVKKNPITAAIQQIQHILTIILTFRQKLNMVKNRVNYLQFRLNKMEQDINNSSGFKANSGNTINQIR